MTFPQAPAGARRILGWRRSDWLRCCGRSCSWYSRRMTKRSSPAGSGGVPVRESYKVVALLLKPSLGLFGLVGRRHVRLPHSESATGHLITPRYHHTTGEFINGCLDLFDELLGPGLPGGVLSLGLPLHHLVVRCVELCPQALNRPDLHFEGVGNGPVFITGIGREHGCTAVHLRSRSLNIVSLSYMIEGSYRFWNLYTTGLQQKKRKPGFIKRKWNYVVFFRATIPPCIYRSRIKSKVGYCSRGRPEGSLLNSYYNEV